MNVHDDLKTIQNNRQNPFAHNRIDAEYKVTTIDFLNEQRALFAEQAKYTRTIKQATWVMAIATMVIALATLAQYLFPLK